MHAYMHAYMHTLFSMLEGDGVLLSQDGDLVDHGVGTTGCNVKHVGHEGHH